MKTKIVFLGSKPIGYQCLKYLIVHQSKFNIEISAVRTQQRTEFGNEHNLEDLAKENQIPILNHLDDLPVCDIIYSVQHHELLKEKHIEKAKTIAVNLHLAPLPEYRGCNQFSFAIIDEAPEFGVTIHEINTKIDNGPILFEKRFPIPKNIWVEELFETTNQQAFTLFKHTLSDLLSGNYKKINQDDLIANTGSNLYFRSDIQKLKIIDLDEEINLIEKRIRATYMPGFELPYCIIDGKKVYFKRK